MRILNAWFCVDGALAKATASTGIPSIRMVQCICTCTRRHRGQCYKIRYLLVLSRIRYVPVRVALRLTTCVPRTLVRAVRPRRRAARSW